MGINRGIFKIGGNEMFKKLLGNEYSVKVGATFSVKVDDEDNALMCHEAEDKAWEIMQSILNDNEDLKEAEMETTEIIPMFKGFAIRIKLTAVIYAIGTKYDDAFSNAVELIENINLPKCVELMWTEQESFVKVGEPVTMVYGECV